MPTRPTVSGKDPAEGSRETISREFERAEQRRKSASSRKRAPAPSGEAARGTPGTDEDICPECRGSGKLGAKPCPNCDGTGLISGIGGA